MLNQTLNNRAVRIKIATYVLLVAFAFFCRGGGLALNLINGQVMTDHALAEKPPCCDINSPLSGAVHELTAITTASGVTTLLLLSLILVWLNSYRAVTRSTSTDRLDCYRRNLRLRYGSARLFEPLRILLSSGKLHPKIW